MSNYLCKSSIILRDGWTETAVKKFLSIEDKTVPNPNYKKAAPMKLYLLERVQEVESSLEFKEFVSKNIKRKNGAEKAVLTKIGKLIEFVNKLEISVPIFEKDILISQACTHYNMRVDEKKDSFEDWKHRKYDDYKMSYLDQFDEPDFLHASPNSEESFLSRISLNYLRHCLTNYEDELNQLRGKTGKDEAYYLLKDKVNGEILNVYPWIKVNTKD